MKLKGKGSGNRLPAFEGGARGQRATAEAVLTLVCRKSLATRARLEADPARAGLYRNKRHAKQGKEKGVYSENYPSKKPEEKMELGGAVVRCALKRGKNTGKKHWKACSKIRGVGTNTGICPFRLITVGWQGRQKPGKAHPYWLG